MQAMVIVRMKTTYSRLLDSSSGSTGSCSILNSRSGGGKLPCVCTCVSVGEKDSRGKRREMEKERMKEKEKEMYILYTLYIVLPL